MTLCALLAVAAAVPLARSTVSVPASFFEPPSVRPPVVGSLDGVLFRMLKESGNWGLSAAQDLTNALSKVTGTPIALVRDGEGTIRLRLDPSLPKRGAWRIRCDGRTVEISSPTAMGIAYGVTDFLERFAGYRFLTIGGDDPYEVNGALEVPVTDETRSHRFYERHFSISPSKYGKYPEVAKALVPYMRRVGLHLSPEVEREVRPSLTCGRHCHTYLYYCPPGKYAKEHPEYYSMDESGKRVPPPWTMLCTSNPDVRRIVFESLVSFIEKDRKDDPVGYPVLYDFTQTDNVASLCRCPSCAAVAAKFGGDAGLQLEFVNDLARKVRARYPDVILRTFAYVSTVDVPTGIRPEPNVMFWTCDTYAESDHMLPLAHPFNARNLARIRAWAAFAPKLEVWDYMLYGDEFPEVSADAIAADMRLFDSLGIHRLYNESHFDGQPFWELNNYLYAKFCRDPQTDLERAIDEYCAVYGKGAPSMRRAIDVLRRAIAENPPKNASAWHQRVLPWRTESVMKEFGAHVKAAFAAAECPRARGRVALALQSTCRELARIYAATPGAEAKVAQAKTAWRHAAQAVHDAGFYPGADRAGALKAELERIELCGFRFKRLPNELKGVPDSEIHCLDIRSCPWISPKNGRKVEDAESECPRVAKMRPDDPAHVLDWALVRDHEVGQCDRFDIGLVRGDGYRWYRLGVSRVGRQGDCFLPVHMYFSLSQLYVECDGLPVDPNWYEFWLSVKYNGDAMSEDLKTGLFVDRLLLRRVVPSSR